MWTARFKRKRNGVTSRPPSMENEGVTCRQKETNTDVEDEHESPVSSPIIQVLAGIAFVVSAYLASFSWRDGTIALCGDGAALGCEHVLKSEYTMVAWKPG